MVAAETKFFFSRDTERRLHARADADSIQNVRAFHLTAKVVKFLQLQHRLLDAHATAQEAHSLSDAGYIAAVIHKIDIAVRSRPQRGGAGRHTPWLGGVSMRVGGLIFFFCVDAAVC